MKILVRDESGVRALEEGYASEAELQEFLRDYAELIPVDEIELGTPPLLCIGWEVGVASGSQDLLYVDRAGLVTVVETKLKRNPEAKREVVGQILEYGAHLSTWSSADIEKKANEFLAKDMCPEDYRGKTLEQALLSLVDKHPDPEAPDFSYEQFLEALTTNPERGHVRLIIAVDEPPDPLLRTVEFVNRFSQHFDMYLLQLKRFRNIAAKQDIFVPAVFGRVASPPREGRRAIQWDSDSFFRQASEKASPEAQRVLRRLHDFSKQHATVVWGRGATYATFQYEVPLTDGQRVALFAPYGDGGIYIDFSGLAKRASHSMMQRYKELLRTVEVIPEEVISSDKWKKFDGGLLAQGNAIDRFEDAVRRITNELKGTE